MPLDYDPKKVNKCWPDGDYDAVLKGVADKISKSSGSDMQEWTIEVYHPDGRKQLISEYVTSASAFKIKQLAQALGLAAAFEAGTFQADDHEGADFMVSLITEKQEGYDDKNRIKKFLSPKAKPTAMAAALDAAGPQFKNDDIPF